MAKKPPSNSKTIAENRKARYNYAIQSDLEVGIILEGSEVKSLRAGNAQITESYAEVKEGELWLVNAYIEGYDKAKTFGHDERRRRKLLASKREISRLWNAVGREGMTLIPLSLYFNGKGRAKMKLGLAKGKNVADKRDTQKKRDWGRQKARLLREHN
ncbi:MAG: SsrA-binding protein SmpB [Pseudomonadota bacterium]